MLIVKAVDIFLTGSGGDAVEECEIELDEDGEPIEVELEEGEEACVPDEDAEDEGRRLKAKEIDPTLRKLGPSLNV